MLAFSTKHIGEPHVAPVPPVGQPCFTHFIRISLKCIQLFIFTIFLKNFIVCTTGYMRALIYIGLYIYITYTCTQILYPHTHTDIFIHSNTCLPVPTQTHTDTKTFILSRVLVT
jgi:hypothetical protein